MLFIQNGFGVKEMVPTSVETYSGYKLDEYPVAFRVEGRRLDIVEIEDRWYSPGVSYFRVFADDAGRYILGRNDSTREWAVKRVQ